MQVYYIFDDEGNVIAIFNDESFARDYLYHIGADEEFCRIGVLSENVFDFQQHDAKYHTLEDSSLKMKLHRECRRFRPMTENVGYCFLMDEQVDAYDKACTMMEKKK